MNKKEQTRLRVERYRNKQKSVTDVTQSPENVTLDVTQYPAIIRALTDPIKREMLEKVYQSLKSHNVADKTYYGYPGLGGVPFDVVGDYLEVTDATK